MSREHRGSQGDKLNFLGGKRLRKEEGAMDVAVRKTRIETGGKLSKATQNKMCRPPLVFFSSKSKYVLFLCEVDVRDVDLDIDCAGLDAEGVERLEWISQSDLYSAHFIRYLP